MRPERTVLAFCLLAACGEGATFDLPTPAVPDPSPPSRPPVPRPPPSGPAELYDLTRVVEVDLFVDDEDWETLRTQTYGEDFLRRSDCQEVAPPFTWFRASAVIDREVVENVAVKKRGFLWTDNPWRPSLEISFDLYEPGKRFAGRDRLVLESGIGDPTGLRTCLAYQVFERAGIPAPRCNLARVRVNGFSLGIYANVEPVDRAFTAEHFAPGGELWEGRGSDFRSGWLTSFEGSGDRSRLGTLASALEAPDAELQTALSRTMDLDAFHRLWAVETVVGHLQGYTGTAARFFVYDDPQRGFVFVPTATDLALFQWPPSLLAPGAVAWRLDETPEGRARHHDEVQAVLAEVWDEEGLLASIDRLAALVAASAPLREETGPAFEALASFVSNRSAAVQAALAAGRLDDPGRQRPTLCYGRLTAELDTTWGTLSAPDPFQIGSATMSADYGDVFRQTGAGFSVAGPGEGEQANLALVYSGVPTPTGVLLLGFLLPSEMLVPGRYAIDGKTILGEVSFVRSGQTEREVIGYLAGGRVDLSATATTAGGRLALRVEADLF